MANITLAIPETLHEKMKKHREIRWSEVVRLAIQKKIEDLELLEKLVGKSKLAAEDALKISEHIDRAVAKKLGLTVQ